MTAFLNTDVAESLLGTPVADTFTIVVTGAGNDVFHAFGGDDFLQGGDDDDRLYGGLDNDKLDGGNGFNTLIGGSGDDLISVEISSGGLTGSDQAFGGVGNDTLNLSLGATGQTVDFFNGTVGTSTFTSFEWVLCSNFADVVLAGRPGITAFLDGGADSFTGMGGADLVYGGTADDTIRSGNGDDTLYGDDGNDALYGGAGDDFLNETLNNINYDDRIFGGGGNDHVVLGTTGIGRMDGGAGIDTLELQNFSSTLTFTLDLARPNAPLMLSATSTVRIDSFENAISNGGQANVRGSGGANVVLTGSLSDTLSGNGGDDSLDGGAGNDLLYGGAGKDTLIGGYGADTLTGGGTGADQFIYTDQSHSLTGSSDTITDFGFGSDKIDLSNFGYYDASLFQFIPVNFNFVGTAAFSGITTDLRYAAVVGGGVVLEGDSDHDGSADFQINLNGVASLTAADLLL